jgi:plastocyanin
MKRRRLWLRAIAASGFVALATVTPATVVRAAAAPSTPTVSIVNFDYGPTSLTVDVGTTVTWTNTSNRPHTVTDRGGTFDSQPILPGQLASVTLTAPGTYSYFCRINPSKMNGTIVVRPSAQPPKVVRVQAADPTNVAGEQFRLDPNNLSVAAGTTLLVANVGGKPHTLTADNGSFTTGIINPGPDGGRFAGSNAVLTLNQPGIYQFHCDIHPTLMRGIITVTGSPPANPPPPASNAAGQGTIDAVDFAFRPTQLSVAPGAKLDAVNAGQAPHTVTFDDVKLDTGTVSPGSSAQLTAPLKPGSYSYHCAIHPAKMRGVLVVLGQGDADPSAAVRSQAKPLLATAGRGPGGRVSTLVLTTGVLGAFFGGLGIASLLAARRLD